MDGLSFDVESLSQDDQDTLAKALADKGLTIKLNPMAVRVKLKDAHIIKLKTCYTIVFGGTGHVVIVCNGTLPQ